MKILPQPRFKGKYFKLSYRDYLCNFHIYDMLDDEYILRSSDGALCRAYTKDSVSNYFKTGEWIKITKEEYENSTI